MPEKRPTLLIVDDEYNTRETLLEFLGRKFDVVGAGNGSDAIKLLQERDFDLILTDLRMPEADGMSVLEAASGKACRPRCIMMTAYGSISDAVQAMKNGAFDFITKPIKLATCLPKTLWYPQRRCGADKPQNPRPHQAHSK